MDHFAGINEQERYNNDLLNETRKANQLQEETNVLIRQLILKIDAKLAPKQINKPTQRKRE